ncbi:hypothetical protein CCHR01_18909 [Colletotrichum chrysophilum]|uniref:Uncharacterized protein n=1 Tax=Colletotrichum chrysophilum TaxID=1836956 RepID=A0AAD8ZZ73_9PEZI|nr:hypothetical protein CCHR01_18909 [Colletotrichum chrysophilum]
MRCWDTYRRRSTVVHGASPNAAGALEEVAVGSVVSGWHGANVSRKPCPPRSTVHGDRTPSRDEVEKHKGGGDAWPLLWPRSKHPEREKNVEPEPGTLGSCLAARESKVPTEL